MKNDKHVEGKMAIFGGMILRHAAKSFPQKSPHFKKECVILEL
jgi:hypothetical protein